MEKMLGNAAAANRHIYCLISYQQFSLKPTALTLTLLTWRIWWALSNASNFNVYYLVAYVWKLWQPSLFIVRTVSQHWIYPERRPVSYLCGNTLLPTRP